ncbi:MAG TPA: HyaD/HybD family hydrogenase maturation endopeptidase [Nitrospiria bacterium]|nr:HyaD/HybD family hydrogenase maturation endopeptidase [Nitrospiria bacterium]
MTAVPSIVVLGVGNTLMRDDGIGVRAVRTLAETYDLPAHVRLVDGGVAGLRCLSAFEGAEYLLIVDAVYGEKTPGAIDRLAPEELPERQGAVFSAHEIGVSELLSVARLLGKLPRTRILAVQAKEAQSVGLDLTPELQCALHRVVEVLVEELRALGVEPVRKEGCDA